MSEDTEEIRVPDGPDPAIVAALVEPLTTLRASLGTGSGAPDADLVTVLRRATAAVADSDADHAHGIHALESSLITSADAVPAMRQTRAELSAMVDQSTQLLAVLTEAHTTNADAARKVDRITARFRRDAREIVDTATSESAADRVLALGAAAYRDALAVVDGARADMNGHRARLSTLRPLPVSRPRGYDAAVGDTQVTPDREDPRPVRPSQQYGPPGQTSYHTQPAWAAPAPYGTQPAWSGGTPYTTPSPVWSGLPGQVPGQPVDPAIMRAGIEAQLQTALINAGVQLGSKVIDGLADVGLRVVDKAGEVSGKVIDGVADQASDAIKEGLDHGKQGKGTPAAPAPGAHDGAPPKVFDFGPGQTQGRGTDPAPDPAPRTDAPSAEAPPPRPVPPPAPPFSDAPKSPKAEPGPATAGPLPAAPPPPAPAAPRKRGQLGVTTPPPQAAPASEPVIEPTP